MNRTLLVAALLSPLVAVSPASAWPVISETPTAIHIELPAVQLPPLAAPSIHYHLHPQALHFPPVDVNLPKGLGAVKTPDDLIEKVLYVVYPQFGPWTVCTLAGSANDADLSKAQSESCEGAVYAQTKAMGAAMVAAARQRTQEINGVAGKAGAGAGDAKSINEPAVESVCQASSYAACEAVAPEACKSVLSSSKATLKPSISVEHELTPAARQSGCENEVIASCATLVQAVCESAGHVVAMQQGGGTGTGNPSGNKEGAK
jgi:hypothetical protein